MLKVLVIFSNPPCQARLRLDREDKVIFTLSRRFAENASIERLHASEIDDIHKIITSSPFDIIHFSGHGDPRGIYVEKGSLGNEEQLVTAEQVVHLLDLAERPPRLALFLSCYSGQLIDRLCRAAPFVITADLQVGDAECIEFVGGFYEWLFSGYSITSSFDHAVHVLQAKELHSSNFKLSRRCLVTRGNKIYVECTFPKYRDSILVNMDPVSDKLDRMGMGREELIHLISRKLGVHYWIFEGARDNALIPIGNLLFGSFSWSNSSDVVHCTNLLRLAPNVSPEHWRIWAGLLVAYNDLASCRYRSLDNPADPANRDELEKAVSLFEYHFEKCLHSNREKVKSLGFENVVPMLAFADAECTQARDQMELQRYPRVISALESALSHFHEIVLETQPPTIDE